MLIAMLELFFMFRSLISDKISRYIHAVSVWTLIVYSSTQILSFNCGITTNNLRLFWVGIDLVLLIAIIVKKRFAVESIHNLKKKVKDLWKDKFFFCMGIYFIIMLILAIRMVPYNWDSMTYHCSRLFHWMQNASVEHYATRIDRQVASPVLGAYINLHIYVITAGSDFFLNLLQCTSYLFDGLLVYSISQKLGCQRKYCIMATVLFYSMPIAFAESLTTQVDNFAALWLLSFTYLLLDVLKREERLSFRKDIGKVVMLSLCVAFGYLTKPSVGIGMVVLVLWLLIVSILRKDSLFAVISLAGCAAIIIIVLLVPELLRNLITFHALSAPGVGARQLIGDLSKKHLLVNCLKNFTYNMPCIWIYDSGTLIRKCVTRFARLLDIDIDNPAISEDGREFSVHGAQTYGCDTAVNPIIVWLLLLSVLLILIKIRKAKNVNYKGVKFGYYVSATVAFVIFCAVLRWEPFVSRYMIAYLALLCPAIVLVIEWFERESQKSILWAKGIIYFVCVVEVIGLFSYHGQRCFSGNRTDCSGYFAERGGIYDSYVAVCDYINQKEYKQIGLFIGGDTYEYPLSRMLMNYERIEHVYVENDTGVYEDETFIPDVIIWIYGQGAPEQMDCHNEQYVQTMKAGDDVFVFERMKG